MRTWQEALADWQDSLSAERNAWASDEALFGLIENVHERLTALETARATAPVSDDEIVEALARSRYEYLDYTQPWQGNMIAVKDDFRALARKQRASLKSLGFDVVKRS